MGEMNATFKYMISWLEVELELFFYGSEDRIILLRETDSKG